MSASINRFFDSELLLLLLLQKLEVFSSKLPLCINGLYTLVVFNNLFVVTFLYLLFIAFFSCVVAVIALLAVDEAH